VKSKKKIEITMKLINIIAAFISILFINLCIYAQEPDPNSFFPMDKGNFWQYAFLNDIVREEYVSKDSLLPDGSRLIYVVIDNIVYNEPGYFIDTNYYVFCGIEFQTKDSLFISLMPCWVKNGGFII